MALCGCVVVGGGGFVGSNLVPVLWPEARISFDFHEDALAEASQVVHLAAQSDISAGATNPGVFLLDIALTAQILEAMRHANIRDLIYFSGSGVYGDWGSMPLRENHGPLTPCSGYGASKLACEALIQAYSRLYGWRTLILRPANIVGPGLTHGVIFDFLRTLRAGMDLHIRGDGTQRKSYVWIGDVATAIQLAWPRVEAGSPLVLNVASADTVSVDLIFDRCREAVPDWCGRVTSDGQRPGWPGDIPEVHLDTAYLRSMGWRQTMTSEHAVRAAIAAN